MSTTNSSSNLGNASKKLKTDLRGEARYQAPEKGTDELGSGKF